MIIIKTPAARISLFGGSSDRIDFIKKNGYGICVSAAIDLYSYISIKKLQNWFPYKTKITYNEIETVQHNVEIKHNGFRCAISRAGLIDEPLEINYTSDIITNSGMGTSSSFLVGLVNALIQYKENREPFTPGELFFTAADIEQRMMNCECGYQDFGPAVFGGVNTFKFTQTKLVTPALNQDELPDKFAEKLEKYGLLIYTGISRDSSTIAKTYINTKEYYEQQKKQLKIAEEFLKDKNGFDPPYLAHLLDKSWKIKRQIPEVSNYLIDDIYNGCNDRGAYGKLMGSGGGGTLFLICLPEFQKGIIEWCERFGGINIPFKIAKEGSERIL